MNRQQHLMPEPSHSGYRKDLGVGGDADSHPETHTDAVARLAGLVAALDLPGDEEPEGKGGFVLQYSGDGSHLLKQVRDLMHQGYELVGAVLPFDDGDTECHEEYDNDDLNPEESNTQ